MFIPVIAAAAIHLAGVFPGGPGVVCGGGTLPVYDQGTGTVVCESSSNIASAPILYSPVEGVSYPSVIEGLPGFGLGFGFGGPFGFGFHHFHH